jgi:hypothetical protein
LRRCCHCAAAVSASIAAAVSHFASAAKLCFRVTLRLLLPPPLPLRVGFSSTARLFQNGIRIVLWCTLNVCSPGQSVSMLHVRANQLTFLEAEISLHMFVAWVL